MRELDEHLGAAREAVAGMDPPADLWARAVERADDAAAPAQQLGAAPTGPRQRTPWLAAAAFVAVLALGATLLLLDDDQPVDDVSDAPSAPEVVPTTTSVPPLWSGPVRDASDVVQNMAAEANGGVSDASGAIVPSSLWDDPLDASEAWADVQQVSFQRVGQPHWHILLAAGPPPIVELEPGVRLAYGLVLDTTNDGAADYVIGIDNDTPVPGDHHVWITNLATGETSRQIGPPYGFPIEFSYPSETPPGGRRDLRTMVFTFLPGSEPADMDPRTVRFYTWTSVTRNGALIASDYAPDVGWMTAHDA